MGLLEVVQSIRPSSSFMTVTRYRNNFGELANFSVNFRVNYLRLVENSRKIILAEDFKIPFGQGFGPNDVFMARRELLSSYGETLSGQKNSMCTTEGVYWEVEKGVRKQVRDGSVHLAGMMVWKKVLERGMYPVVNSERKTLAKNYLRSLTPLNKWVQFKLVPGKFERVRVDGKEVRPEDA